MPIIIVRTIIPCSPYFDYPLEMAELVDLEKLPAPIEPDTENAPVPDGLGRERALRADSLDRATIDEIRLGYYASTNCVGPHGQPD